MIVGDRGWKIPDIERLAVQVPTGVEIDLAIVADDRLQRLLLGETLIPQDLEMDLGRGAVATVGTVSLLGVLRHMEKRDGIAAGLCHCRVAHDPERQCRYGTAHHDRSGD